MSERDPVDPQTKRKMIESRPQGGIPLPACHCEACQHEHFTTQTRLTSLEAITAILEQAVKSCAMSPEKRWELQQKLGDLGTSPIAMRCGCFPVEWNPYNKAVCCHTCGRNIAIPKARIVYDTGGA